MKRHRVFEKAIYIDSFSIYKDNYTLAKNSFPPYKKNY